MATDVVNSEHNKLEHDPTMASIAGPSMGDLNAERSTDEALYVKADQATPQGLADQGDQFE